MPSSKLARGNVDRNRKAFQLRFIAQTETIVAAIPYRGFVVIIIILAVVANTMAMTVRERVADYPP